MLHWYVMHSKPQKELFLYRQLCLNQVESYLPLIQKIDHFGISCTRAFFPGYLFVRADISVCGVSQLLWIPGSKGIVCFGGEPANVSDSFIEGLMRKMDSINTSPRSRLMHYQNGDAVTIANGPFEGFQAIFNQYLPGQDRVRLLLKTLAENSIHIDVPAGQLAA